MYFILYIGTICIVTSFADANGNAISWQRVINAWGCPKNGARDGHAKKNSHPPFLLTKRHLWRRDEKFSLLPWLHAVFFCFIYQAESCSSAFKALSVYSRERTCLLFYYSTTIIPPFLLFRAISFASMLQLWYATREDGSMNFSRHRGDRGGVTLHAGPFSYWITLRQSSPSLLFIVCL